MNDQIKAYLAGLGRKGGSVSSPAKKRAAFLREQAKREKRERRERLQLEKSISTNEINGLNHGVNYSVETVTVTDNQA